MISSEPETENLLARARRLLAGGYQWASVVDRQRADELVELYEELGHEVVVLQGAVRGEGEGECDTCLMESGVVTLFVKWR